jgi:hypothetical protein
VISARVLAIRVSAPRATLGMICRLALVSFLLRTLLGHRMLAALPGTGSISDASTVPVGGSSTVRVSVFPSAIFARPTRLLQETVLLALRASIL